MCSTGSAPSADGSSGGACTSSTTKPRPERHNYTVIPARDALAQLEDGNRRFVSNIRNHESHAGEARRLEVATGQEPFAIILGCSDSRVPAEIVFDQGLGDLFVIRVAGNIVAP